MDLRQLRYFLAIAEERQITRAARRLHIAQPPLSQQLQSMEAELGVRLVQRVGRQLELTPAGRQLQGRAEEILGLMEQAVTEVRGLGTSMPGTLAIGTVPSSGAPLLSGPLRRFHERYPEVQLHIWGGDSYRLVDLLESRTIALGLVRLPLDTARFAMIPLETEPLIAVANSEWTLPEGDGILLSELAKLPLLLLRRDKGPFVTDMLLAACQQAGFYPDVVCESHDLGALFACVNIGMGVAIVPRSAMSVCPYQFAVRVIREPNLQTTVVAAWLRKRPLPLAASRLLDLLPVQA